MRKVSPKTFTIALLAVAVVFGSVFFLYVSSKGGSETLLKEYPSLLPEEPSVETGVALYIEINESCGALFEGDCVHIRIDPNVDAPSYMQARAGMVLPVAEETVTDESGREWYRVQFTEWIRYTDRVPKDLFIAKEFVTPVYNHAPESLPEVGAEKTNKRIVVDRSEQTLSAYEGDELYMQTTISTGLDLSPTPRGTFTVFRKTPSRYMQGPLPGISDQYYDLPGVPWTLYFTQDGGAIHGAYWHNDFGAQRSHGCVNLPLDVARQLYEWAPVGTIVTVQD